MCHGFQGLELEMQARRQNGISYDRFRLLMTSSIKICHHLRLPLTLIDPVGVQLFNLNSPGGYLGWRGGGGGGNYYIFKQSGRWCVSRRKNIIIISARCVPFSQCPFSQTVAIGRPIVQKRTHVSSRLEHGFSTFWQRLFPVAPRIKVREPNTDLAFTVSWKLWQEGWLSFAAIWGQRGSVASPLRQRWINWSVLCIWVHFYDMFTMWDQVLFVSVTSTWLRSDWNTRMSASHHHRAFAPKRCLISTCGKDVTGPNILAGNKSCLQWELTASILHEPAPASSNAD